MAVTEQLSGTAFIGAIPQGQEPRYFLDAGVYPLQEEVIDFIDSHIPENDHPVTANLQSVLGRFGMVGLVRYDVKQQDGLHYTVRTISDPPEEWFGDYPSLPRVRDTSMITLHDTGDTDFMIGNYSEVHFKPVPGQEIRPHPIGVGYSDRLLPMGKVSINDGVIPS